MDRPHQIDDGEKTETRDHDHWEPLVVLPRELGQVPPAPTLIGVKAHGLAQLQVIKARTPRFGVLTRPAFDLFEKDPALAGVLEKAAREDLRQPAIRAAWSERLMQHASAAPLPEEVDWALNELLGAFTAGDFLAVRASVVAPLADAREMRGCFETSLFIEGEDELRLAVQRAFASAWSLRCLHARFEAGLHPIGTKLAIIIQRMVDAEVSGTCRSIDPTGRPGADPEVAILATPGLAGGMARGRGSASIYLDAIHLPRPTVASEGIADNVEVRNDSAAKMEALAFDSERGQGTKLFTLDDEQRQGSCLNAVQSRLIASEALRIESALGGPQDLEFSFAGRLLHFLGTTAVFMPSARVESKRLRQWDERLVPEGIRGVTTPLSFGVFVSTWVPAFVQTLERLGGPAQDLAERRTALGRILGSLGGRTVLNVGAVTAFLDLLPEGALLSDGWARSLGVKALLMSEQSTSLDEDTLKVGRLLKTSRRLASELDPTLQSTAAAAAAMLREDFDRRDPDRLLDNFETVLGYLRQIETEHLICDGCAAAFFGVLERMIQHWLPEARRGLVNDLFSGMDGEEASTSGKGSRPAPTRDGQFSVANPIDDAVQTLAGVVENNAVLKAIFAQEPQSAALLDRLDGLPAADAFWDALKQQHLDGRGRFCAERKLESPGLHERPDVLLALVSAQLLSPNVDAERQQRATGVRTKAEYAIFEHLSDRRMGIGRTSRKKILARVLFETREALRRRALVRAVQLDLFALARRLALVLGQRLFEHSILAQPADVFYLGLDEMRGLIRGTALDRDPKPHIGARKRQAQSLPSTLPEAFETVGVLATADLESLASAHEKAIGRAKENRRGTLDDGAVAQLQGRAAVSGLATGPIAHLYLKEDVGGFEVLANFSPPAPGSIVVVRRADPGLLNVLAQAQAVICERGDLLSPGVVALRALGIPTVIGVSGALSILETAEHVRVDGRTGQIECITGTDIRPTPATVNAEATQIDKQPALSTDLLQHALPHIASEASGRLSAPPQSAAYDDETQVFPDPDTGSDV